jgi:hypothetical protein
MTKSLWIKASAKWHIFIFLKHLSPCKCKLSVKKNTIEANVNNYRFNQKAVGQELAKFRWTGNMLMLSGSVGIAKQFPLMYPGDRESMWQWRDPSNYVKGTQHSNTQVTSKLPDMYTN